MIVQAASLENVSRIIEIWKELMDYHSEIDPVFNLREDGPLNFKKWVEKLIQSEESAVFIAINDAGIISGYTIGIIEEYPPVFLIEKYGAITDMAVDSRFRRQGAGELLLSTLLEWFQSRDVTRAELKVACRNPIGNAFWRKNGFSEYLYTMSREI